MQSIFNPNRILVCLALLAVAGAPRRADAGTEIEAAPDKKVVNLPERPDPQGRLTLGAKVSEDQTGVFLDAITPLWSPGDFFLFLNTRATVESSDQALSSYGLGARYLLPDQEVIVGVNAYYDALESQNGHHYDELGIGAEVLTRWVDARFNYYLPDESRYEIGRGSSGNSNPSVTPVFGNRITPNRILLQQQKTSRKSRTSARDFEFALEGWNAEIGFLVPGLDQYLEVRLFAGAYGYGDFTGVKARVEARPLPGLIANVEYWDDAYLMGGHWTGELAVSVPFDIFNLARGRNPFEGFTDSFRPRQREFRERLSDMVARSHRVMTNETTTDTTASNKTTRTTNDGQILLKPPVLPGAGAGGPPQVGQGEGGDG